MSSETKVVLVDNEDNEIGTMGKKEAHDCGVLHRAFSVFVFNENNELLLQQRAFSKYHSPGLWTNTCCSHPLSGEDVEQSAHQRLFKEMGFDCIINKAFEFLYKVDVGKGIIEHEYDYVFIGTCNDEPTVNHREVAAWKYMSMEDIRNDIENHPENYTEWFKIAFEKIVDYLKKTNFKVSKFF